MNFRGARRWIVVLGLVLLLGFATTLSLLHAEGKAEASGNNPPKSTHKDFGNWSYSAAESTANSVEGAITYDQKSVQALKGFVKVNTTLAKQLRESATQRFEGLLTFNHPLSVVEFTQLVNDQKLTVKSYIIRMATPSGERITITGTPDPTALVPQDKLDREKGYVLQQRPNALFKGVVDAEVSFDAAQFDSLQAYKGVFLVDITKTLAKKELQQEYPQADVSKIYVDSPHSYWYMEDLGLSNFQ